MKNFEKMEAIRDAETPKGIVWPQLWALRMTGCDGEADMGFGIVMQASGIEDSPEVYWSERAAKRACKYNHETHDIQCVPVRIRVPSEGGAS